MKPYKKSRFINLAAQLASQNDIVSSTMDSLLAQVSQDDRMQQHSDQGEIQKTTELNPGIENDEIVQDTIQTSIPKSNLNKPTVTRNRNVTG